VTLPPVTRKHHDAKRSRTARLLPLAAGLFALAVPLASASVAAAATLSNNPIPTASVNGRVREVAYSGNTLFLVGEFTTATDNGSTVTRNHAAAIDTSTRHLLPWNPNVNGVAYGLAVDAAGGAVYLAGNFSSVGGVTTKNLAKVSASGTGAAVSTWKHTANNTVWAVAAGNGRLYAAGSFTTMDSQARSGLAAFSLSSGVLDATWKPSATGGKMRFVVPTATRVYVSGEATAINGVSGVGHLGAVNPSTGAVDNGFIPKIPYRVFKFAVTSSAVYAAADGNGGHLWSVSLTGAKNWIVTADGGFQAATLVGGMIVAGGHFDNVCTTPDQGSHGTCTGGSVQRKKLILLTTSGVLQSWAPQADSAEGDFALTTNAAGTQVAAGGDFTHFHFGSVSQAHVAVFSFS
jgi:hypothetical protein